MLSKSECTNGLRLHLKFIEQYRWWCLSLLFLPKKESCVSFWTCHCNQSPCRALRRWRDHENRWAAKSRSMRDRIVGSLFRLETMEAATNWVDPLGGSRLSRPSKADTASVSLPIAVKPFHCRSNNVSPRGFLRFTLSGPSRTTGHETAPPSRKL